MPTLLSSTSNPNTAKDEQPSRFNTPQSEIENPLTVKSNQPSRSNTPQSETEYPLTVKGKQSSRLNTPQNEVKKPLTVDGGIEAPVNDSSRIEKLSEPDTNPPPSEEPAINESGEVFALTGTLMLDAFATEDKYDKSFVKHCLDNIPLVLRFRAKAQYNYLKTQNQNGRADANTYIRKLSDYCRQFHAVKSMNDDQVEQYADNRAKECYYTVCNMLNENDPIEEVLEVLEAILRQNGIRPRKGKYIEGDVARYTGSEYWYKKLRKVKAKAIEQISRHMGIVHRHCQIYVTDYNLRARREAKRRTNDFLASMEMINELGDSISLKEASDSNVSNPVNKRNELMCRLSGMEAFADKHGYKATFITITAPSRMHAVLTTGKPNLKYDNTSSSDAHQFLGGQWAKSRAALARVKIDYFGMRVVEPHHDGTPHWHLLVFVKPDQMCMLEKTLEGYALEVDGDELGAKKHRFTIERIDKRKGSAVGYVAKYIAKNVDGYGVDNDRYGKPANEAAERICEWSGLHGIRQFQQFGGPAVTVWREARRIALSKQYDGIVLSVLCAADSGDWCAFMEAMNGANVSRNNRPVTLYREFIEEEGQYIEPIGYVIKGLCCDGEIFISREHEWTLKKIDKSQHGALGETAG
jgi:hypothetical protein